MKTKPAPFDPRAQAKKLAAKLNEVQPGERIVDIALKEISPDPNQHRRFFDPEKIRQLGASIAESGQESPIVLRRTPDAKTPYMIVTGERRWRACGDVGRKTVKAVIRDFSDADLAAIVTAQANENWQREGLLPAEAVSLAQQLLKEHGSLAIAAKKTGQPKPFLSKLINIGSASETVQKAVDGRITDDVETLYVLTRLDKKDPSGAARLVAGWLADKDSRVSMRAKLKAALDRLAATKDGEPDDDEAPARPESGTASRKTGDDRPASRSNDGLTATHGSARDGQAAAALHPSTASSVPAGGGREVAQAQPGGRSRGDAAAPSAGASGGLIAKSAEASGNVITIRTDDGAYRFDRASLAQVLAEVL